MKTNDQMTYREWVIMHAEDLQWIVKMAQNGIKVTPGAGNHPASLMLHMLECDVTNAAKGSTTDEV